MNGERFHFGPLVTAGVVTGVGMGGFVDGILFHQILQVHNMFSARIPVVDLVSAKTNMLWDGYFHAGVYLLTLLGLVLTFRAGARRDVPWSGRAFLGCWLFGFGLFNLVEGLIDHEILGIHHVLEYADRRTQGVADVAFLLSGVVLMLLGGAVLRSAKRAWAAEPDAPAGAGTTLR